MQTPLEITIDIGKPDEAFLLVYSRCGLWEGAGRLVIGVRCCWEVSSSTNVDHVGVACVINFHRCQDVLTNRTATDHAYLNWKSDGKNSKGVTDIVREREPVVKADKL